MERRLFTCIIVFVMCCAFPALSGDYRKGFEAYKQGDYATALVEFRELAEQGNASAQFNLGLMHERGLGVSKDAAMAGEWYLRAAGQGKAEAQFRLGALFESGTDASQDFESAVKWYRRAAERGLEAAQFRLGSAFHMGQGVAKDDVQAEKWLRRAANQDVTDAQVMLGEILFAVRLPSHNNAPAYMWMSIAASSGDATAKKKKKFFTIFMTPNQLTEGERLVREWKARFEEDAKRQ